MLPGVLRLCVHEVAFPASVAKIRVFFTFEIENVDPDIESSVELLIVINFIASRDMLIKTSTNLVSPSVKDL